MFAPVVRDFVIVLLSCPVIRPRTPTPLETQKRPTANPRRNEGEMHSPESRQS
jgi:hypothetical protein